MKKPAIGLIYFSAVWCQPCKAAAPLFKKLMADYGSRVDCIKLNADTGIGAQMFNDYGIAGIPCFLVRNRRPLPPERAEIGRVVGVDGTTEATIRALLDKALADTGGAVVVSRRRRQARRVKRKVRNG